MVEGDEMANPESGEGGPLAEKGEDWAPGGRPGAALPSRPCLAWARAWLAAPASWPWPAGCPPTSKIRMSLSFCSGS